MGATNRFSEAAWELQMSFSKRRRKAICCSHVVLEQLLALQQEGLGKSVKMLKHFARGKKNLFTKYKINKVNNNSLEHHHQLKKY
jgi:hypothetical protein